MQRENFVKREEEIFGSSTLAIERLRDKSRMISKGWTFERKKPLTLKMRRFIDGVRVKLKGAQTIWKNRY